MKMQQGIMGSNASPDLWISSEKNPRSAELRRTFCDAEFRQKKPADILGKTISRSPLHKTRRKKPEDEFRRTIGLNTKFRRKNKKQQKSGTQFV